MHTLARVCVQRPVFATVLSLALVVVGLAGYANLGVDRFPTIDFPFVTVTTLYQGASPEEVETEITDKIERQVNTIGGLEDLTSTSGDGISVVMIRFELSKDADVAAEEVRAKVALAKADLPTDSEAPIVSKFDTSATAVLTYAISSAQSLRDTYEYVDKHIRRQLESVSGIGEVQLVGGRERQINIVLDPYRLRAYGLTAADVTKALRNENAQVPGGVVEQGDRQLVLRTRGRLQSIHQFADIPLKTFGDQQILVGDVATVEDGESRATSLASIGGRETVVLSVIKQSGANAIKVIEAAKERMAEIDKLLPEGYEVVVARDQSTFILAALGAVREHLVLGAILAALVVLMFLGGGRRANVATLAIVGALVGGWLILHFVHLTTLQTALVVAVVVGAIFLGLMSFGSGRATIIAALAIPTSIITTFAVMRALGFTQNVITLLALTLSVGIVIDDAIVVLENIFRVIEEQGLEPAEAAIHATREIGLAVLAITLSLLAVFLPVAFMSGIVGRFLNSFGITMACAITVSMFISFSLTPMLCSKWLTREHAHEAEHSSDSKTGWFGVIDRTYTMLLEWSLAHRWVIVVIALVVLGSTIPLAKMARKNFLPNDDQSLFTVQVRAPEGSSLEGTRRILEGIARDLDQLPEVELTLVTIASDNEKTTNSGTCLVKMNEVEARGDRSVTQFTNMAAARKQIIPKYKGQGLRMSVQAASAFGSGNNADIQIAVSGPDLERLGEFSDAAVAYSATLPGVADSDTSLVSGKPEMQAVIDRRRAAALGVTVADVAQALRLAVGGDDKITSFDELGEQYEVHVRLDRKYRTDEEGIQLLEVPSSVDGEKGTITLDQVVEFEYRAGFSSIQRYNRQRQFTLYVNLLPTASQGAVQSSIMEFFEQLKMGPGYRVNPTGRSRELGRTFRNFLLALMLSAIFMYLVISAQFESFIHAIVIMVALPITFPFGILSIVLTHDSLNIYSMLGLLVLLGVVKKNAILQIDRANQLRDEGFSLHDATVQAARDRLRPILMTTLAFVAGMIPLVLSRGTGSATNHTTGGVIVGGQVFSLLLTLLAVPTFYTLLDGITDSPICRTIRRVVFRQVQVEHPVPPPERPAP